MTDFNDLNIFEDDPQEPNYSTDYILSWIDQQEDDNDQMYCM